jgi:hypothetical protein
MNTCKVSDGLTASRNCDSYKLGFACLCADGQTASWNTGHIMHMTKGLIICLISHQCYTLQNLVPSFFIKLQTKNLLLHYLTSKKIVQYFISTEGSASTVFWDVQFTHLSLQLYQSIVFRFACLSLVYICPTKQLQHQKFYFDLKCKNSKCDNKYSVTTMDFICLSLRNLQLLDSVSR